MATRHKHLVVTFDDDFLHEDDLTDAVGESLRTLETELSFSWEWAIPSAAKAMRFNDIYGANLEKVVEAEGLDETNVVHVRLSEQGEVEASGEVPAHAIGKEGYIYD